MANGIVVPKEAAAELNRKAQMIGGYSNTLASYAQQIAHAMIERGWFDAEARGEGPPASRPSVFASEVFTIAEALASEHDARIKSWAKEKLGINVVDLR